MAKQMEWEKRVAAWRASGKAAHEFCKGQEFSARNLKWWSWRLERKGVLVPKAQPVKLARVVRKPERKRSVSSTTASSAIVVHVGGARVEVGAAADRVALGAVLDTLLSSSASATGGKR